MVRSPDSDIVIKHERDMAKYKSTSNGWFSATDQPWAIWTTGSVGASGDDDDDGSRHATRLPRVVGVRSIVGMVHFLPRMSGRVARK